MYRRKSPHKGKSFIEAYPAYKNTIVSDSYDRANEIGRMSKEKLLCKCPNCGDEKWKSPQDLVCHKADCQRCKFAYRNPMDEFSEYVHIEDL